MLFRSAALAFGPRVTGVILSGLLDDGAAGLWAIRQRGGATAVQDRDDAEFADMPRNAMQAVAIDVCVAMRDMAAQFVRIAHEPVGATIEDVPGRMASEVRVATTQNNDWMEEPDPIGKRVPLTLSRMRRTTTRQGSRFCLAVLDCAARRSRETEPRAAPAFRPATHERTFSR